MDNSLNTDTILIPTVLENSDNGNYFLMVPKNTAKMQPTINHQQQLLMPKTELLQFSNNSQHHHFQLDQNFQPRTPIRSNRDDKRRTTHNEIERRRRDKISTWISQLATLLPLSSHNKNESKGETLIKVCEYIAELQGNKESLTQQCSEFKAVKESLKKLEDEVNVGLEENGHLKDELLKCGFQLEKVAVPDDDDQPVTTYIEYVDGTHHIEAGHDAESVAIHTDIDTYFQS